MISLQKYSIFFIVAFTFLFPQITESSIHAQRLYQHLFVDREVIPTIRPIIKHKDTTILFMNLSLAQVLELNVKSQYLKLNVWIQLEWRDPQFIWNPKQYGNVTNLYIPSSQVWLPDMVLYNNAGTTWDISSASGTKIKVNYNGKMEWKPPIILMSQCNVDVEYFPFDVQSCILKMGTWTTNGFMIDLRHYAQKEKDLSELKPVYDSCRYKFDYAIDLTDYVESGEWDLLEVSAARNIAKYPCCAEPYIDVTFTVRIKRKTLFYGINLICPCVCISFLAILVFYLPADPCEKITLSISIFIACIVFILVIFDISPPTSLVVPLIVKYLLFTLMLVFCSIIISIIVLKVKHEDAPLSPTTKRIFLIILPKILGLKYHFETPDTNTDLFNKFSNKADDDTVWKTWQKPRKEPNQKIPVIEEIENALVGIRSIANLIKDQSEGDEIANEWNYISVVMDRFFLYAFGIVVFGTTFAIYLQAPSIIRNHIPLTHEMADSLLKGLTIDTNCTKLG